MATKEEYDSRSKEFQESMKPLQEKMMSNMQNVNPESKPESNPDIEDVD